MEPRRAERLSEALREELDEMISYELADPRIETSGVVEVAVSPDARHARVRVLLPGDAESQRRSLEALNGARNYIRRELAQRIDLYRIPDLHFESALATPLGGRLEHLLRRVRRGRPRDTGRMNPSPEGEPAASPQAPEDKGSSQKNPVS